MNFPIALPSKSLAIKVIGARACPSESATSAPRARQGSFIRSPDPSRHRTPDPSSVRIARNRCQCPDVPEPANGPRAAPPRALHSRSSRDLVTSTTIRANIWTVSPIRSWPKRLRPQSQRMRWPHLNRSGMQHLLCAFHAQAPSRQLWNRLADLAMGIPCGSHSSQ